MYDNVPTQQIEEQVLAAMEAYGIPPLNGLRLEIDGKLHRYAVTGDKGQDKSGAYIIYPDGLPAGYIMSWRHGVEEKWRFDTSELDPVQSKICNTPKFKAEVQARQKQREAELAKTQARAAEQARIRFEAAKEARQDHEYLKRKNVQAYGLKEIEGALIVPLMDGKGQVCSFQRIFPDGEKRFFDGASTKGLFFTIGADIKKGPVLMCEGYATGATLHELSGCTVICAMNAGNLEPAGREIRRAYPSRKIVIAADDDAETAKRIGHNPGLVKAAEAVKMAKLDGVVKPPFKSSADGTDWNDFAAKYGKETAARALKERVAWECMSKEEREKYKEAKALSSMRKKLDEETHVQRVEMIGGMFPRGHVSAIIAAPGVGKTWFVQRFASDLSVGGAIFGGVGLSEPKKTLIMAGEAGYETLIRRAREVKWNVNKDNVIIYSMIECMLNGISFDLGTPEGQNNLTHAVELDNPEVVFIDTLTSFHSVDENKAVDMKPIFEYLMKLAKDKDIALVIMHHTRKRKLAEQKFRMSQDEAIGSSVFNRLAALIIGIEPIEAEDEEKEDAQKVNIVRTQKTWFKSLPTFSYSLGEDENGRTVMTIDLDPKIGGGARAQIWDYIQRTYEPGVWFKAAEINSVAKTSGTYVRRCLAEWVKISKLKQRGEKRGSEYALNNNYSSAVDEVAIPF